MSDEPIIPSAIIPAGEPIPGLPGHAPEPGELPPWRRPVEVTPPPPPPPVEAPPPVPDPEPPPQPPPFEAEQPAQIVHVHVTVEQPEPEAEPWWRPLLPRLRPWAAVAAVVAPFVPTPTGYSAVTTWAYIVAEARHEGVGIGYAVGGGALVLATTWLIRRPGLLSMAAWVTALTGFVMSAIHWYDPITWLTGVTV